MKTISLKMPEEVFEKVEKYRKAGKMNRTSYVLEAVAAYNEKIEREELAEAIAKEIERDREMNKGVIEEWDTTVGDNLADDN